MILEDEDLSDIPPTTQASTDEQIRNVKEALEYRKERRQNSGIFEMFATLGARGLGKLCNGKREFFGGKPDLVGWHISVARKVRAHKYETAEFVKQVTKSLGIGNGMIFFADLIFDAVTYSIHRTEGKENKNKKVCTETEASEAMDAVNKI
jgi:hypothetical protein